MSNAASASLLGMTSAGSEKWATTAASFPSCESLDVVDVLSFLLVLCKDAMLAMEDRLELRPLARPISIVLRRTVCGGRVRAEKTVSYCLTRIYTSTYRRP